MKEFKLSAELVQGLADFLLEQAPARLYKKLEIEIQQQINEAKEEKKDDKKKK